MSTFYVYSLGRGGQLPISGRASGIGGINENLRFSDAMTKGNSSPNGGFC